MYLRQSTTQTIRFGPFLDITDGVTEEISLTITQALMRLSKDGGAFAQKNAAGNATHDSDGWYSTALNTTDTATVGELILNVQIPATALPVWMRFWVIEEAIYDLLFGAGATGLVTLDAVTHTGAVIPTVTTLTGHTAQTGDSFARIGAAGASLTNIDLPNQTMDITGSITGNLTGSVGSVTGAVGSVTAAVTVGTINANVINAASINANAFTAAKFAAASLNGKGDWNIGKTGYSLTVAPLTAAQVQTEVDTALATVNLDHLVGTATAIPTLPANTYLDTIRDDGTAVFDRATDSLQAISDTGGGGPTVAQIADGVWDELLAGHVIADSSGLLLNDWQDGGRLDLILDDIPITSEFNARTLVSAAYFDPAADTVTNVTNVTAAVTVGTINANVITATAIAANAFTAAKFAAASLNGKGDWNIGKTGYALTQVFPTNFADLDITPTQGRVDVGTITTDAITTASIANGAFTAAKFGADFITATSIATGAIDVNALATDSITAASFAAATVDKIRDGLLPTQNVAFSNIEFLWVAASDHVTPVTGASTTSVTRSIDGGSFVGAGGTLAEVGNGIYQFDASSADMNGGIITFRFVATGGTPGAPDDAFVTIVTGGGV